MKKKKIILILIAIFTCICLVGCETKKDEDNKENTENTLKISYMIIVQQDMYGHIMLVKMI